MYNKYLFKDLKKQNSYKSYVLDRYLEAQILIKD